MLPFIAYMSYIGLVLTLDFMAEERGGMSYTYCELVLKHI